MRQNAGYKHTLGRALMVNDDELFEHTRKFSQFMYVGYGKWTLDDDPVELHFAPKKFAYNRN